MCGPCTVSSRDCVFFQDQLAQSNAETSTREPHAATTTDSHVASGNSLQQDDEQQQRGLTGDNVSHSSCLGSHASSPSALFLGADKEVGQIERPQPAPMPLPPHYPRTVSLATQGIPPQDPGLPPHDTSRLGFSPDPASYEKWTADFASTCWLDLLANDAAQADSGFSLAESPTAVSQDSSLRRRSAIPAHASPALLNGQAQLPDNLDPESERRTWQSDGDVALTAHEAILFRHFTEKCARWLEACDPQRHFSTYAIHLALKNPGLMKAVLALSAKHRLRCLDRNANTSARDSAAEEDSGDNEWIRYYYETLHYIQKALVYSSYTHSEELLATAIVISAYEMLDESDGTGNWQRHLKGVFWIQRSQDVNGGCGGLRQSVWWAWLAQDIWAAFREKRPCLSIWRPVKDVYELDKHELASHAVYLLSQAVNYSAHSYRAEEAGAVDPSTALHQQRTREELLTKMEQWESCLGDAYNSLPTPRAADDVFAPLWVHPPHFAMALQAYSFARVLLTLHSPHGAGLTGFLRMQKTLTAAVEAICGIAMELRDEGCQIFSAQCLYGAGLCVQDSARRDAVLSLMEKCEDRVGWAPMAVWRDDLRREWEKVDREASGIAVEKRTL